MLMNYYSNWIFVNSKVMFQIMCRMWSATTWDNPGGTSWSEHKSAQVWKSDPVPSGHIWSIWSLISHLQSPVTHSCSLTWRIYVKIAFLTLSARQRYHAPAWPGKISKSSLGDGSLPAILALWWIDFNLERVLNFRQMLSRNILFGKKVWNEKSKLKI